MLMLKFVSTNYSLENRTELETLLYSSNESEQRGKAMMDLLRIDHTSQTFRLTANTAPVFARFITLLFYGILQRTT